ILGRLAGPGRWRAAPPRLDNTAPLAALSAGMADDGLAVARAAFERLGGSLELLADDHEVGFSFKLRTS
ncbi:hypothetical protein, partial [Proteus mirabilis]|uniref:hypothetical protein n=1 Tax=Proteus mirabilis TaxID=584 RepID=UPI001953E6F7